MTHEVMLGGFTEALNKTDPDFFFYIQNELQQQQLLFIKRQVILTQDRQGWQAAAQRPAQHCRRAGLGPGGGHREMPLPLLWLLLLL